VCQALDICISFNPHIRAGTLESGARLNSDHPLAIFIKSILKVGISYPCFSDEEVEAQRGYSSYPKTHTQSEKEAGCQLTFACSQSIHPLRRSTTAE